jgi:hypothetical protein
MQNKSAGAALPPSKSRTGPSSPRRSVCAPGDDRSIITQTAGYPKGVRPWNHAKSKRPQSLAARARPRHPANPRESAASRSLSWRNGSRRGAPEKVGGLVATTRLMTSKSAVPGSDPLRECNKWCQFIYSARNDRKKEATPSTRGPASIGRCGLTAKQVPHRPGIAPALGLRAGA